MAPIEPQSEKSSTDLFARHYTRDWIGALMLDRVGQLKPNMILELGVGAGSLIRQAGRKWSMARIVTVDVDPGVSHAHWFPTATNHKHFTANALDPKLSGRIGVPFESVDLALGNPPFLNTEWSTDYTAILQDSGLAKAFLDKTIVSSDILFTAQNLRFLRRKGVLALILPDTVFTAQSFRHFREELLTQHQVKEVIQLPRGVFSQTEAQAHVLFLQKGHGTVGNVAIRSILSDRTLSDKVLISLDQAAHRMDYSFYADELNLFPNRSRLRLRDLIESIHRGCLSSSEARTAPFFVFHLDHFDSSGKFSLNISDMLLDREQTFEFNGKSVHVAQPGHILIARVGRNHQTKVCVVNEGTFAFTDCVFRIVPKKERASDLVRFLRSSRGQDLIRATSRGVAAKHVTKEDLLQLPVLID